LNLHVLILTRFYVKFIPKLIYTDLYEYVLNLFENMLTAGLPHTAAPLDSRTLPRALLDSRIPPRTLPRTLLHCYIMLRTPRTLHALKCRTPHTAHTRIPQLR
jgi:hypothetical protein